jgi:hypothetical protein
MWPRGVEERTTTATACSRTIQPQHYGFGELRNKGYAFAEYQLGNQYANGKGAPQN